MSEKTLEVGMNFFEIHEGRTMTGWGTITDYYKITALLDEEVVGERFQSDSMPTKPYAKTFKKSFVLNHLCIKL